ncbi:MAG: hypothetical protein ABSC94_05230 [Polyangiaceae bacterium]|jgi:hypothetical protein
MKTGILGLLLFGSVACSTKTQSTSERTDTRSVTSSAAMSSSGATADASEPVPDATADSGAVDAQDATTDAEDATMDTKEDLVEVGNAVCTCDADVACQQGTVLEFTPSEPTQTLTINIVAPGYGLQDYVGYDLDVSAFTAGGILSISGMVGGSDTATMTAASFDLFSECTIFPTVGGPLGASISNAYDIPVGGSFSLMPVTIFPPGTQLFHFGATGNWYSEAGLTNTVTVTISVAVDD